MTTETEDKLASARSQARAQYYSIVEMVGKLRAADDDGTYETMAEELAKGAGFTVLMDNDTGGYFWAKINNDRDDQVQDTDGMPDQNEDEAWLACCDDNDLRPDADEARQEIEEDALSVEVRSSWQTVGETLDAAEFRILLCTGGPAVQIRGELNEHHEPSRAWLECQDWFTPWTQVFDVSQNVILAYAACFYFGE